MTKALEFLKAHKMSAADVDIKELVDLFLSEMKKGLEGENSSLMMIPTYVGADNDVEANKPVLAIDAGGTNFRAAKIYFDQNMKLVTENTRYGKMPAVDRELSNKEFFDTLAGYLADYKSVSGCVGFCFSYAVEMFPNKDGKLIGWSKEVKAPEVVGQMIGENLLKAMGTPNREIVILNDTVATLLAGKAATAGKEYDTYIGFILGTGTNTCYIESNKNITKTSGLDPNGNMIINIESGNFDKASRGDIDVAMDNLTKSPGTYAFEKMISGGYFGPVCTTAFKQAAAEGLFTTTTKDNITAMAELTSEEVNKFVCGIELETNPLVKIFASDADKTLATEIIEGLIERASKLVAANIASVVLKTGKAKTAGKPVLMTIEGTTFYKLKDFRKMFESYMQEFLSGENKRYYEIVEVENSSLVGAAIAAIVN